MTQISPEPLTFSNSDGQTIHASEVIHTMDNTIYTIKTGPDLTLFLPAYAVLLVKSVDSIRLKDGTCNIKATLVLRIMLGDLKEYSFITEHLKERISFRLNEQPFSMKPDDEDVEFKVVKQPCLHLVYTYRFETTISFAANLRSSPFDKLNLPIKLELTSRTVKKKEDKSEKTEKSELPKFENNQVRYRFNFHKYTKKTEEENGMLNLKFKDDDAIDKMPEYNLLYPEMGVEIKIEQKKDPLQNNVEKVLIQYAPVFVFKLAFYRNPFSTLLNCLGPLIAMMVVPLAIYCQPNDLANKLGSLITLLLAIIAYFPTLRAGLPSMPYLTITDLTACLCILQVMIGCVEALCLANLDAVIFSRICLGFLFLLPVATITFLAWKIVVYLRDKRKYDIKPESKNIPSNIFEPAQWEGWRPKENKDSKDSKENKENKDSKEIKEQKEHNEHKVDLENGEHKEDLDNSFTKEKLWRKSTNTKKTLMSPRKQTIMELIKPHVIFKYNKFATETPNSPNHATLKIFPDHGDHTDPKELLLRSSIFKP